jgi:hypothetical protein
MNAPSYFLWLGERQTGPFALVQVRAMRERGEIAWSTLWTDGVAEWRPLHSLEALFRTSPPVDEQPVARPVISDRQTMFLVVLLACALLGFVLYVIGQLVPRDEQGDERRDAYYTATANFMPAQLKSPSSASFSGYNDSAVSREGDVFTVSGWVEAENSFGTALRRHFTCKMQLEASRHAWVYLGSQLD